MTDTELHDKLSKYDTEHVFLCYKNADDEEEFTPICDVLEFGAPTDLDGDEMELMNDQLYVFSEELQRFVLLQ